VGFFGRWGATNENAQDAALIAAMLFFSPSMVPVRAVTIPCGLHPVWLPTDTAFAGPPIIPCPVPPPGHGVIPGWFWAAFACPASIILSGIVANFKDNRQLTTAEAWTCGLLYWFGVPPQQQVQGHH
jgi:hypothetical protein